MMLMPGVKSALRACTFVALTGLTLAAQTRTAPPAPASVGISSERLARLHQGMQGFVDRHEVSGIVTLIAREGKTVDVHAVGLQDIDKNVPMKADSIFRIASMSKPITSVAIMMLYEEGKLRLNDPVSRFIPAFAETKVAVPQKKDDGTVEIVLEPQARAMTVQDLMRHTSGLTYGAVGTNKVKQSYLDMKVAERSQTNAESGTIH